MVVIWRLCVPDADRLGQSDRRVAEIAERRAAKTMVATGRDLGAGGTRMAWGLVRTQSSGHAVNTSIDRDEIMGIGFCAFGGR